MKTMTAPDAKTQLGQFLDTSEREPAVLTKEAGYDEWLQAKVAGVRVKLKNGDSKLHAHDDVMDRVWNRLQTKAKLRTLTV